MSADAPTTIVPVSTLPTFAAPADAASVLEIVKLPDEPGANAVNAFTPPLISTSAAVLNQ